MENNNTLRFLVLILMATLCISQRPFFPRAIVLPITKDLPTSQYITHLKIGPKLAPLKLVLDLGGPFLWADYGSSQYDGSVPCGSLKCSMANPKGCVHEICEVQFENPVTGFAGSGVLREESIAVELVDDPKRGSFLSDFPNFLFSFVPSLLLQGLGNGVDGVLGLGNCRISLPSQLANGFGFPRKFALCLSSSANGVLISGDTPYDVSRSMIYTPLIPNPNGTAHDHYISVRSIKIGDKKLPLNNSLAKISTIAPYTTLGAKIYQEFIGSFLGVVGSSLTRVLDPLAPFEVCFKDVVDDDVVGIEFVLQSEMVRWRMKNAMVKMSDGSVCLGLLNGGLDQTDSIVIGGYQLEDNLLEFNLGTSMLGFTSQTSCSQFTRFSNGRDSV